jgi:hypothetical protein
MAAVRPDDREQQPPVDPGLPVVTLALPDLRLIELPVVERDVARGMALMPFAASTKALTWSSGTTSSMRTSR